MLTGAEFILKQLEIINVTKLFGIPGAQIDPLFAAATKSNVKPIINCHELSAGYMADGYARATSKLGVVTCIGGPGASNLITAVTTAKIEKSPLLVITGDVPTNFSSVPGFQCANQLGSNDDEIFKIITKYSKRVKTIDELNSSLSEAIKTAFTPPFGPTHLIAPFDVLINTTNDTPEEINLDKSIFWNDENTNKVVEKIKDLILSDKKIIFWIGSSLNTKKEGSIIQYLAEKFNIPITTSYSGKGVISEKHKLSLGNFGFAGSCCSKDIFLSDELDHIIGFDIEMNERNSLNWNENLFKNKEITLVNYPNSFVNNEFANHVINNPFSILKQLKKKLENVSYSNNTRKDWIGKLNTKKAQKTYSIPSNSESLEPSQLIFSLNNIAPKDTVLFVDSGNHRVFPGFFYKAQKAASFYSAETTAPLGWALAASIGAKFERNQPTVVFTGDGCMQMHGIELKTAIKHKLPLLVIINNNNAFGSIYKRLSKIDSKTAEIAKITEIDWTLFGKSIGANIIDIDTIEHFEKEVYQFFESEQFTILNVSTPDNPFVHDINLAQSAFSK